MLLSILRKSFLLFVLLSFSAHLLAGPGTPKGNPAPAKPDKAQPAPNEKAEAATEKSDPAKTIATKRRDPFFSPAKFVPPPPPPPKPPPAVKPEPKPVPPPSIENRVEAYKSELRNWYEGRGSEPSKIKAYLIDELTLTGVFRTEEGYGAFLVSNQQTYFARAGWQTYDGYIKEILPNGIKFAKTTRLDNGVVQQTEVFRPLPAINAK